MNIMHKLTIIIALIIVSVFAGFCYSAKNSMDKNIQAKLIPAPSDSAVSGVYMGGMNSDGSMDLLVVK
jgi:hypothetical protein